MQKKEIKNLKDLEDYDPDKEIPYHFQRYKTGGMHMSYVNDAKITNAMIQMLKQISSKIIAGDIKNIISLQKPTSISTHYTFQEVLSLDSINTHFLDYASLEDTNPIQKLQLVLAHMITSYHYPPTKIYNLVPLDPRVGETCIFKKKNGTIFSAECVVSRPPSSLVHIIGKDKAWEMMYYHTVAAKIIPPSCNVLQGQSLYDRKYKFKDGTEITSQNVTLQVDGLLIGERVLNKIKSFQAKCVQHKLLAEIVFNSDNRSTVRKIGSKIGGKISGFLGKLSGKKKEEKEAKDKGDFSITIYKVQNFDQNPVDNDDEEDDMRAVVSVGGGNWTSHLWFDDKLFWRASDPVEEWTSEGLTILPSDSQHRQDKMFLQMKDPERAEKVLNEYETQEVKDRELRKKYGSKKN